MARKNTPNNVPDTQINVYPATLRAAYHAGPPEIQFLGRRRLLGVPHPVTKDEWAAMRARPDFKQFDFKLED